MESYKTGANGYVRKPILDFLDWADVVPDELHCLLRLFDLLMNLLTKELFSIKEAPARIVKAFADINIKFQFYTSLSTGKVSHPALMGKYKLKALRTLNFATIFTHNPARGQLIQQVWRGLASLYDIWSSWTPGTGAYLRQQAEKWKKLFLTPSQGDRNSPGYVEGLYTEADITPYFHLMYVHFPDLIDRFGNLQWASCHSLEGKHRNQVLDFFGLSTHEGCHQDALRQIMRKEHLLCIDGDGPKRRRPKKKGNKESKQTNK